MTHCYLFPIKGVVFGHSMTKNLQNSDIFMNVEKNEALVFEGIVKETQWAV